MIRTKIDERTVVDLYGSLDEWVDAARQNATKVPHPRGDDFTMHTSFAEACEMAETTGWAEGAAEATVISESALRTVEREHDVPVFAAEYLMAGSEVDVGRCLQGIPECMIEYEPRIVSRVGTVVTLCASVSVSGAVDTSSMVKRGAAVVGLAMALQKCAHAVEIYVTVDICEHYAPNGGDKGKTAAIRCLLKGAHDEIDPDRLAFALAHPAMLRQLAFGLEHALPREYQSPLNIGTGYGIPMNPIENLPDGTIYLPCVLSPSDVPDADTFIADHLRSLGLID